MRAMDRKLVLEDGSEYYGYGFGAGGDRVCEIVFNTSLAGYQEIVSDPSYTDQLVVMTYPLIVTNQPLVMTHSPPATPRHSSQQPLLASPPRSRPRRWRRC